MARNLKSVVKILLERTIGHYDYIISKEIFIDKFKSEEMAKILNSTDLRLFVLKYGGFKKRPKASTFKRYTGMIPNILNGTGSSRSVSPLSGNSRSKSSNNLPKTNTSR